MANCYQCGSYVANGEGYRRDVYTGSSGGMSSGLKGNTRFYAGQRTGIRTLCVNCAQQHDVVTERANKIAFVLTIGFMLAFFAGILMLMRY